MTGFLVTMNRGIYDATSAETHSIRFDHVPVSPFCRAGCWLNMLLSENTTAGHARNRLRVTIIRPERNIPEALRLSDS